MQRGAFTMAAALALGVPIAAIGQATGPDLAKVRAALANATVPVADRAARALEAAAELDRIAQEARSVADRRGRWAEAAALLDEFARANPDAESTPLIRFQAAVYLWAEGRSFAEQVELAPSDAASRTAAIDRFDRAIALFRLAGVKPRTKDPDPLAQNIRFRLAQALGDRAKLEKESEPSREVAEREAVGLLEWSIADPKLRGFARLLRGELNNRLGQFNQAQIDIEDAEKAIPPPDPEPLARAKVAALIGRTQFAEARKVAAEAKVDEAARGWLSLRVLLAQRRLTSPGADRSAIDAEAFGIAATLRASNRPEATRALMELAGVIDEPGEDRPAEWWEILAEGHLRLGNPSRAGRVLSKGADRAEAAGHADQAAAFRMKAGACLFEAEKFAEADRQLARVSEDAKASRDLRARAGMLRTLARGRALALKQPGATRESYVQALEEQVRLFPDDTTTGEARWLLGKIRRGAGRREEAIKLWSAVSRSHARWLESRLAAADLLRDAVNEQRINGDHKVTSQKGEEGRRFLALAEAEAAEGNEAVELSFRVAFLELIPEIGRSGAALDACERILKGAARPDQHEQARLIRIVALARGGQLVEAERDAREEARRVAPVALLPSLRLLDRVAGETDSDLNRRRTGKVYRILANRLAQGMESIPPRNRDEARLRVARSMVFAGEQADARREIAAWGGPSESFDNDLLRDLADTFFRLESYPLAADAERLRGSKLPAGTPGWFESRYNLALADYRDGKIKDARQIIDATAILHPDLGGAELRQRFEKLRQKLAQE